MRLRVLNSGSSANGYVLYGDKEALAIECGVTYREYMSVIGFKRNVLKGVLVSHNHGDHIRCLDQFLEGGIHAYMSEGTWRALSKWDIRYNGLVHLVEPLSPFRVGGFDCMAFDTQHDCPQPFGFLIRHKDMGTCLFATDTYYIKYVFEGLNHVMLECNYNKKILSMNVDSGEVPSFVASRTVRSHMSLETALSTLKANDLSNVRNIVLLHLSSRNSDADAFQRVIESETGIPVYIASPGLDIDFDKDIK